MPSQQHQAALCTAVGAPLTLTDRTTPHPGPDEILIEVKAIALNPVDVYQRDHGMPPVQQYPTVLGSDVAGIVVETGSDVSSSNDALIKPGARVLALASGFYNNNSPDYGSFQQFVLAKIDFVAPLPQKWSFEEGAVIPLAAMTALVGFYAMDLPISGPLPFLTEGSGKQKQGILIWGASSSVGSLAVQTAKLRGFNVYATAGQKNLEYIKQLGADAVFDYKSEDVVAQIVRQVEEDKAELRYAHVIIDAGLKPTLDVLEQTKGGEGVVAKVAHAPVLLPGAPSREGVEVKFNMLPMDDAEARAGYVRKCFHGVLREGLGKEGGIVPSPRLRIFPGGLAAVNEALDLLRGGVSCTKLVLSV